MFKSLCVAALLLAAPSAARRCTADRHRDALDRGRHVGDPAMRAAPTCRSTSWSSRATSPTRRRSRWASRTAAASWCSRCAATLAPPRSSRAFRRTCSMRSSARSSRTRSATAGAMCRASGTHCRRASRRPAGDAADAAPKPSLGESRNEEGYADLVGLAWTRRAHPRAVRRGAQLARALPRRCAAGRAPRHRRLAAPRSASRRRSIRRCRCSSRPSCCGNARCAAATDVAATRAFRRRAGSLC